MKATDADALFTTGALDAWLMLVRMVGVRAEAGAERARRRAQWQAAHHT